MADTTSASIAHPPKSIGQTVYKRAAADPYTVAVDGIVQGPASGVNPSRAWVITGASVVVNGNGHVLTVQGHAPGDPGGGSSRAFSAAVPVGAATGTFTVDVVIESELHTEIRKPTGEIIESVIRLADAKDSSRINILVDADQPAMSRADLTYLRTYPVAVTDVRVRDASPLRSVAWRVNGGVEHPAARLDSDLWRMEGIDLRVLTGKGPTDLVTSPIDLEVRAVDGAVPTGNEGLLTVPLADSVAPELQVRTPAPGELFSDTGNGATVRLSGVAEDHWTGVAAVQYSLDNATWTDIPLTPPNATSTTWAVNRSLDAGVYTILVRARDGAGNLSKPESVAVEVRQGLLTDAAPLGETEYLRDLTDFAARTVTFPRNSAGAIARNPLLHLLACEVSRLFHAPVPRLLDPAAEQAATSSVNELRPVIEGFRRVLDSTSLGLVARWPLDTGVGSVAYDASGNGFAGTLEGGVSWQGDVAFAPGGGLTGLVFDGTDGRVRVSPQLAPALVMHDAVTVAAWIHPTANAGTVLSKEGEYQVGLNKQGRLYCALATATPWATHVTDAVVPQGQWSHVAVVFGPDGSGGRRVTAYLDGRQVGQFAEPGVIGRQTAELHDVRIGGRQGGANSFTGGIRDVRLYRATVPPEVVARLAGRTPEPITAWAFDEGSGTAAGDVTGTHTATLTGASWVEDAERGPVPALVGTSGIEVTDAAELRVGADDADFTASLWLKLSAGPDGTWRSIVHKGADAWQRTFAMWLSPDSNRLHARISTTADPNEGLMATTREVPLDRWTHVAYVKAGRDVVVYLDGRESGRARLEGASVANNGPLRVGNTPWYGGFSGRVSELRLESGARTGDEIALAVTGTEAAEAHYRLRAYEALLVAQGTSYEEVRLIRGAPASRRTALAARLGFPLRPTRPDELDLLFASPDAATEQWLEATFGLQSSRRDPFVATPPPSLLTMRLAALVGQWEQLDYPGLGAPPQPPIVDPDVLGAADFAGPGGPVDLWRARRDELADYADSLRAARDGAGSDLAAAFAAVVVLAFGRPANHLDTVAAKRATGGDVTGDLASLHLDLPMLDRLLGIQDLARAGILTDDEWTELFDILVQAHKGQLAAAWREQERTAVGGRPLVLSPDHFVVGAEGPGLHPWRASAQARRAYEERLLLRARQREAVSDAFREGIREIERLVLPLLRDALVPAVLAVLDQPDVDALSQRLLVDAGSEGALNSTRAGAAIACVQSLLLGVRSTSFGTGHPANAWSLPTAAEAAFDADWQWMGSADNWRAAMLVFFYPDMILLPTLRPAPEATPRTVDSTAAFRTLVTDLRKPRAATPTSVLGMAEKYAAGVRDAWKQALPAASEATKAYVPDPRRSPADQATVNAEALPAPPAALHEIPAVIQEMLYFVPLAIGLELQRTGEFVAALDWFQLVYNVALRPAERKVYRGLRLESNAAPTLSRAQDWLQQLNPHELAAAHGGNPYTRYTMTVLARCLAEFGDSEFTLDLAESTARARSLYLTARDVLRDPELSVPAGATGPFLVSPALDLLRNRVANRLRKIRQGRNIAGMKRQVEPPAAAAGAAGPATDSNGVPILTPPRRLRPTPYRFTVLLERSRQLVNVAAQVEAGYLASLEKRDAEAYSQLRAGHDLVLASAGEQLQRLRVTEAQHGVDLVKRQQDRVDYQQDTYRRWRAAGLNAGERATIAAYKEAAEKEKWANGLSAAASVAQALISAAAAPTPTAGLAAASAVVAGGASIAGAVNRNEAVDEQTKAQEATIRGSYERRQDEWDLQIGLADQDLLILDEQARLARDHKGIADQELTIATTQGTQAKAVSDFLATKFTNTDLYEWMSGVLGEVYSYFLQQATATAQLAEQQLAFERQVQAPRLIKDDYWVAESSAGAGQPPGPDRRGLTGSARLLQDIATLDQFAFESDRRKLNLSQTFSLATLFPFEFEEFRTSGVLPFSTPSRLFDQGFPGHYLRLIKRVRTSMVALVPPAHGIRAELVASGVSRTVVGGDTFAEVVIRREPERVAFTSGAEATGVFDLDLQSDMLLPFEAMGVDTQWQFELPRPANPLDYSAIADILVTVEYTALWNSDYRRQVIEGLDRRVSAERAFHLRDDAPDEWYLLTNPDQSARPLTARFDVRPGDFPPNVTDLRVAHILLYVDRPEGSTGAVPISRLRFYPGTAGGTPVDGGAATTTPDGIVSTRRPNGSAWIPLLGLPEGPVGTWEVTFEPAFASTITAGRLDDVFLVLSIEGQTPLWPER